MNVAIEILKWFKAAKPEPKPKDISTQYGCHLEEVSECLKTTGDTFLSNHIKHLADEYKEDWRNSNSKKLANLTEEQRIQILDDLCDQVVTAIGTGHMLNMDIIGALNEVNNSNWSKFNEDGRPDLDENGKIKKGHNYFKPNLKRFA